MKVAVAPLTSTVALTEYLPETQPAEVAVERR